MAAGEPTAIITDASVLVKPVVAEPESEQVRSLLGRYAAASIPLLVLPLTRYEVGNALLQARRRARARVDPRTLRDDAQRALELATEVEDPRSTMEVAARDQLSYYDAAYLALTLESGRGARLWTFDARLGAAAEAERVRFEPPAGR